MNRRVFGVLALFVGYSTACSDLPTDGSRASGFDPLLAVSDPPPPPADAETPPCDAGCQLAGEPLVLNLNAKYFSAPGRFFAFATFGSQHPDVEISHDARVRDLGSGVVGTGTITTSIKVLGGTTPVTIDLSTATGTLALQPKDLLNFFFSFTATARHALTGAPLSVPVLFFFVVIG